MDRLPSARRSWLMSRVKGKDTTPELAVRRAVHSLGLRFRLHRKDMPGTPDLVFPRWRVALFVHGCFWHRHFGCPKANLPKSNIEFWLAKFFRNVDRDKKVKNELLAAGWRYEVVWECETKKPEVLKARIKFIFGL
ncbi:very short patch repair endonuclease [Variovorax sp. 22077]|uniref:very short patch repair endonuclease n=1 Tax=Variovorax sp. 22077 TaxID=3453867 RepID=UPI003F877E01